MTKIKHRLTKTPEYRVWNRITQICHNKNHPDFEINGGAGIEVCKKWRNDPVAFIEDVGQKPTRSFFQRIDRQKNFEPGNVEWTPILYRKHRGKYKLTRGAEYSSWCKIKSRCFNPNNPAYGRYGGRGVSMFDGWKDDFMAFYNYLGPKPSKTHSVDRVDNNRGYEPGNVRWATTTEQNRNKRSNINIKICCQTKTLAEWCEIYGLNYSKTLRRMRRGWGILDALDLSPQP